MTPNRWDDPDYRAEHARKIKEGLARRKAEEAVKLPSVSPEGFATTIYDKDGNLVEEVRDIVEGVTKRVLEEPSDAPAYVIDDAPDPMLEATARTDTLKYLEPDPPFLAPSYDDASLDLLRRLYQATRLRNAAGGWQVGRCLACNVPHVRGICVHKCPCHAVGPYLEEMDRMREAG